MSASETQNNWETIQQGVRDTERLIGQKQYNHSMVKARQTLEFMVKLLGEKACIIEGDLVDIIDNLYQGHWISKSTCEHYHKIRMIGNKAVHEANNNAYDANQAYHMLSQEVYVFANEYTGKRKSGSRGSRPAAGSESSSRSSAARTPSGSGKHLSGTRSSGSRPSSQASPAASRSRKRSHKKRRGISNYDLLKLMIPVLCIILLIALIRFIRPATEIPEETTTVPPTTIATPAETSPPETMTPVTQPTIVYKTTTTVNVRPQPNTDQARIAVLPPDTEIEVIEQLDNGWTKFNYNGQEVYISSQHIKAE